MIEPTTATNPVRELFGNEAMEIGDRVMVFPRPEWEKFRERIAALPMSAQWWKRIFLGNAMDVEMDGTGRVLISPELRQAAGISKDTMLLGMGNHFELWDKATYDAQEAQAMQGEMPDVFKDFSF